MTFDRRLTPARPDLAAAQLRGTIEAAAYVEGRSVRIAAGLADLRPAPSNDASIDTQALYGETALLYEDNEGWGWVQLDRDGYVGYLSINALGEIGAAPTHRVKVNRTFIYPAPNMKLPILELCRSARGSPSPKPVETSRALRAAASSFPPIWRL